jgi:hypothetical protein
MKASSKNTPLVNPGVNPADKPSKGNTVSSSGGKQSKRKQVAQLAQQSQILREARRERLVQLSEHSRLVRLARSAPRKESVCPIKRSVASLAMNVPTGESERESSVSSLGSDDDCANDCVTDRDSVNGTNSQKRSPAPRGGQQKVETHRIVGTDLTVSAICKNLVTDIVSVFGTLGVEKMAVDSLLQHLCADSTKPWSTYQGKPMGARQLNRVLTKELGIHSYDIRVGVDCGTSGGTNGGANGSANNSVKGSKTVKGLHRKVFELLQVLLNAGYTPLTQANTQLMPHKRGFEPAVR